MSWASVTIFRDPRGPDEGWVELVDSLDDAASYLRGHPGHVGYEIGDDGACSTRGAVSEPSTRPPSRGADASPPC